MSNFIFNVLVKGILAGVFIGLIAGVYVSQITRRNVIQKDDYSHPIHYEDAERRYVTTMTCSFAVVFAFCGPFVAAASFGDWIRHVVYGVMGSLAAIVCFIILVSSVNSVVHRLPLIALLKFPSPTIAFAQSYGVPAAFLLGPIIGLIVGAGRSRSADTD